jgi:thiamine-monophosphate kinase
VSERPSEFQLISRYFAPLATDAAALGLMDDAALLKERAGFDLVVTTDALTEGVHFLSSDPPDAIASKALRVNLSDLAAKGAHPAGYLLALALPRSVDAAWLEAFARGLGEDQKAFGVSLLGGDTTATPGPLTIAITALGHVPSGGMIRRSGARPGDGLYVSGTIGDAGVGLAILRDGLVAGSHAACLVERYRRPTPRLALGQALRGVASAALDVSDGLMADVGHIAEVSKVRLVVVADWVPCSQAVSSLWGGMNGIVRAATAGDDYEIAFTAAPDAAVEAAADKAGVPVTRIGSVEAGQGVVLVDKEGRNIPIERGGFTHF